MRIDVNPTRIDATPGAPAFVTVHVFNTGTTIAAFQVRVLGVDPSWVEIDRDRLSLFPDANGIVSIVLRLPAGLPAGTRRLTVEVVDETDLNGRMVADIDVVVPADRAAAATLEPGTFHGAKRGTFGLVVQNDGNTALPVRFEGIDSEDAVEFEFDPPLLEVQPGEQGTARMHVRARRPLAGQPKVRVVEVNVEGPEPPIPLVGAFVQRPVFSRGLLGLVGLLAAVSIFALVITTSFSRLVDRTTLDEDLLLQALDDGETPVTPENGGIVTGRVSLQTTQGPVPGVTVELFRSDNAARPVKSDATDADGRFVFGALNEGTYKARVVGAGFAERWYEDADNFADADEFEVALGETTPGIDIALGGVPGSIEGTVLGADPIGAIVTISTPGVLEPGADAELDRTSVDATGQFRLENVATPTAYRLQVVKPGFATETRVVNMAAGEDKKGIEINLRKGDGSITGLVTDDSGQPLGAVQVIASEGDNSISTVSLTQDDPATPGDDTGTFTLRNLATPATYTLVASTPGFATETVTVSLAAQENRGGVGLALAPSTGAISGQVRTLVDGAATPAGGVTVTVTDGSTTLLTATYSTDDPSTDDNEIGRFVVQDLPVPSTYTVSFAAKGFSTQSRAVEVDEGANRIVTGVDVVLVRSTATLSGIVSDRNGDELSNVDIRLSNGTFELITRSADRPPGSYAFNDIPPGNYTVTFSRSGSIPQSQIVDLAAGQDETLDVTLADQASIFGVVNVEGGGPQPGVEVTLYRLEDFPSNPVATLLTDANGVYDFRELAAPETYTLEYTFPTGTAPQKSQNVVLRGGERKRAPDVTVTAG